MSQQNKPRGTQLKFYVEESNNQQFWGEFVTEQFKQEFATQLLNQIKSNTAWKDAVNSFSDITTTYTNPQEGWTVSVKDTNLVYRYDEATRTWINILSGAISERVTATKDGLMPKELYAKFSNGTLDAQYVSETNDKKFVTQAQIDQWNSYTSFDGYAGLGGMYGRTAKAARSDHDHEELVNLTNLISTRIKWKHNSNIVESWYDTDKVHFKGNSNKYITFRFGNDHGVYVGDDRCLTSADSSNFVAANSISDSWKNKLSQNFQQPSWNDLRDKPSDFAPSSHTHTIDNLSDVNNAWYSLLRNQPNFNWESVSEKPAAFEPTNHYHDRLHLSPTPNRSIVNVGSNYNPYLRTDIYDRHGSTWVGSNLVRNNKYNNRVHVGWFLGYESQENINNHTGKRRLALFETNNDNGSNISREDYIPFINTNQEWRGYQDFLSGAGNTGSDMRFKSDIKPVQSVLESVKQLEIFSYKWNKEGEQSRDTFGVNASQLLQIGGIFEKLVHERDDEDKTKWVEYDRLGVVALKAIQELITENNELKKRLEVLESKI